MLSKFDDYLEIILLGFMWLIVGFVVLTMIATFIVAFIGPDHNILYKTSIERCSNAGGSLVYTPSGNFNGCIVSRPVDLK